MARPVAELARLLRDQIADDAETVMTRAANEFGTVIDDDPLKILVHASGLELTHSDLYFANVDVDGLDVDDTVLINVVGDRFVVVAEIGEDAFDKLSTRLNSKGAGLQRRRVHTIETAALAANATENGQWTFSGAGARIFRVECDADARVRIYAATADRTADAGRAVATANPLINGALLDVATNTEATLTPPADLHSFDSDGVFYYAVQNRTGSTRAVTVTLTYLQTE